MSQRRIRRQPALPTLPYWRSLLASVLLVLSILFLFEFSTDPRSGELRSPAMMAPAFGLPKTSRAAAAGGGGYGPYFGSIPDFGQVETGVRFSDVKPNSPAAKAGLKAGRGRSWSSSATNRSRISTTSPTPCAAAKSAT